MHISKVIEQLGYPKSEVKIYLAALDMGESTITELASKVGMPRTSVQSIINDMQQRGLMNSFVMKKRKVWVAENPDKLMIKLKESEAALKTIMPELQAKRFIQGGRPLVKVFTGPNQIKLIMDDIVETKRNFLAIISWDDWRDFFGDDFVNEFIERRRNHFLNIRLLTPRSKSSLELKKKDQDENRHTRFLPEGVSINNTNFVYGSKVAIISLNKRQPVGIVMEDPDVAHTITIMFEALWSKGMDS